MVSVQSHFSAIRPLSRSLALSDMELVSKRSLLMVILVKKYHVTVTCGSVGWTMVKRIAGIASLLGPSYSRIIVPSSTSDVIRISSLLDHVFPLYPLRVWMATQQLTLNKVLA